MVNMNNNYKSLIKNRRRCAICGIPINFMDAHIHRCRQCITMIKSGYVPIY
jgi:ribosomal protein S14